MSETKVPYYKNPGFWIAYAVGCVAFIGGALKGDDFFEYLGYTYFGQEKPRVPLHEIAQLSSEQIRDLATEYLELATIPGVGDEREIDCRTVRDGYIINVLSGKKLVAHAWIPADPTQPTAVSYAHR